jgi:hypothetical protein
MREVEIGNVWKTDYGDIRCNALLKENNINRANVITTLDQNYIKEKTGKEELIEKDVKEVFEDYFIDNFEKYVRLPKISRCSKLMQDVYDSVCLSDASMCHITEEDWENFYSEDYSKRDFENFKKEVNKYGLQHVIGINDCEYKIIGYSDLELKFNDDRFINEKEEQLEL